MSVLCSVLNHRMDHASICAAFMFFFIQINGYKIYSSKNVYDYAFTKHELLIRNDTSVVYAIPHQRQSVPIHLHMLLRHGARYPGVSDTNNAISSIEKIKGKVRNSKFNQLNTWELPYLSDQMMQLTKAGADEHYGIGTRFSKRYEHLLNNIKENEILMETSSRQRTIDSCNAFKSALEDHLSLSFNINCTENDMHMRFFDHCPRYNEISKKRNDPNHELKKYKKGKLLRKLSTEIQDRLKLSPKMEEGFTAGNHL